jgi:hypothetical protein
MSSLHPVKVPMIFNNNFTNTPDDCRSLVFLIKPDDYPSTRIYRPTYILILI